MKKPAFSPKRWERGQDGSAMMKNPENTKQEAKRDGILQTVRRNAAGGRTLLPGLRRLSGYSARPDGAAADRIPGRAAEEKEKIPVQAGLVLGAFIHACSKWPNKIVMGKMRWPMTWYLSTILTHGMTGLAMAVLLPGTNFMVMGIGSVLFMISDMVLTAYRFIFKNNKWLIRLNSLTYFTGLLLIVISTAL